MRILAIESASVTASVAIVEDDVLTAEYTMNYKKTHSQTLLPMIDEICRMTQTASDSFDLVAVSTGPGSFTGLRIGVATAKGIALAHNIPMVSVPTLTALAYNLWGTDSYICPVMDARRQHVYGAVYHFEESELVMDVEQGLYSCEELSEKLAGLNKRVIILGDGCDVLKAYLEQIPSLQYTIASVIHNSHRASAVAAVARSIYQTQGAVAGSEIVPDYIRPSQAEREMEAKHVQYKTYES